MTVGLHTKLIKLTGLQLHGSLLFPHLNSGLMRASLHNSGTSPVCIESMRICAIASPISSLTSCKNLDVIRLCLDSCEFSNCQLFFLVNSILINSLPLSTNACLGSVMLSNSCHVNSEMKYLLSISTASNSSTITSRSSSSFLTALLLLSFPAY